MIEVMLMNDVVTVVADQLKVVPVQSDAWVVDVVLSEMYFVMYDLTGNKETILEATLT